MIRTRWDVIASLAIVIVACAPFVLQQYCDSSSSIFVHQSASVLREMHALLLDECFPDAKVYEPCCGPVLEHDSNRDGRLSCPERMYAYRTLRERAKVCEMYLGVLERVVHVLDPLVWTRVVSMDGSHHLELEDTRKKS